MSFFDPQNPGIGGLKELTIAEQLFLTNFAGLAYQNGDVLYYNNGSLQRLAIGTEGQALKVSAGLLPYWGVDSAGVAWGGITGTLSNQTDLQSALDAKQATLVSGTNIKTVNCTTLLGSGDLVISTGLTVGTTTITSGTTTRILYNNAGVLGEYTLTGSGTVVAMQTAPTFVTNITTPIVYGSAVANGDIIIDGTSHATKTTSIVNLQSGGGLVRIGATDAVGDVATGLQVNATTGTAFRVTGNNPYNPALQTTAGGGTTMYYFSSQNFATTVAFDTRVTGGRFVLQSGAVLAGNQQAFNMTHEYASIGVGTCVLDSVTSGGPSPTQTTYKIIQGKFLGTEEFYINGQGAFVFNEQGLDGDCRIEGDNDANLFYTDAGNDRIGIGTATPDNKFHTELSDAVTNAVSYVGRFTHVSTGTPATGFGVGLEFELETATVSTNKVVASIEFPFTDATAGSEDADFVVKVVDGGTLTERLRINSDGVDIKTAPVRLKGYTVAGLPVGTQGDTAFVTDALAPAFLTAVVGGGAIVTPVFYDGTNWVAM